MPSKNSFLMTVTDTHMTWLKMSGRNKGISIQDVIRNLITEAFEKSKEKKNE